MNRRMGRALGLLTVVATLGIWFTLSGLGWPARALTTFLLGPLPALMILQARLLDQLPTEAEREGVYFSSAFSVWALAALAMMAASGSGLTRSDLGIEAVSAPILLGSAGATAVAGLAIMAVARLLHVPESPLVEYLIPRTAQEKIAFVGLSVSAGIAEELVFRSFLIAGVFRASGSLTVAVTVSVAAFAVTHAYQGIGGVLRVAVLGLVLTAPLLLTGSVFPAMIAHTTLDLTAGLVLAEWLGAGPEPGGG